MPSSRRTPRRRKRLRADMESAPTVNGRVHDQPGNRNLVAPQTHVGDDACIVPGTLLHRKVPGRDKSLPYKPSEHDSPNRDGRNHPGVRRAGCPHPAAPRGGANTPGGYGIRPYGRRRMRRPTGKLRSRRTANPCRGRCLHCARRRVSEANRAAGPALRPEIVPGTLRWREVPWADTGPTPAQASGASAGRGRGCRDKNVISQN